MAEIFVESVGPQPSPTLELAERKGIGHPDTICDGIAERFSAELSRFYLARFGRILHHNVDKALLRGGSSRATFGGGEVTEPIDLYLAGRAVTRAGDVEIPVADIAESSARAWLAEHLRALDPERHVRIHCLVRSGSVDLRELFARSPAGEVPLANDTSFGVGYAPLGDVERTVLDVERRLNTPEFLDAHPGQGEDVKVLGFRSGAALSLTVARAMVARHVPSLDAYRHEKQVVAEVASSAVAGAATLHVNAADSEDGSVVYLTVTGTSAESGDDGQVGRGNRGNGLITPLRAMSLEALAGKNPVTHVGKLYNVVARAVAEELIRAVPGVVSAQCFLVSRIGARIDEPQCAHVRLGTDGALRPEQASSTRDIVRRELAGIGGLHRRLIEGALQIF